MYRMQHVNVKMAAGGICTTCYHMKLVRNLSTEELIRWRKQNPIRFYAPRSAGSKKVIEIYRTENPDYFKHFIQPRLLAQGAR
jgi:hypothetical protein